MAHHSNITCLPFEILKIIFENLKRKEECLRTKKTTSVKDIRTCLHVCKALSYVAKEFISRDTSIKVEDIFLEKLSNDIHVFGHKVKSITLCTTYRPTSRSDYNMFKTVLVSCPNLVSVYFTGNGPKTHRYLETLLDITEILKSIQQINTIKLYSLHAELIYLKVILRYNATITSLRILQLEEVMRGAFFEIISCFPKLASLETTVSFLQSSFSIRRLLKAAPQLQALKISAFFELACDSQDTAESSELMEPVKDLCLTKLDLNVGAIDIKDFRYIMREFKQIKDFNLKTDFVGSEFYSTEESKKLADDLKVYTAGMENVMIKYKYNDEEVFIDRKGRPFVIKGQGIAEYNSDIDDKVEEIIEFLLRCHSKDSVDDNFDRYRYGFY